MSEHDLIVVGGGIAGSAAALRAVQYNLRTAWFRGDADTRRRSRGQWVANIDNMIGIHDAIVRKKLLELVDGEAREAIRSARLEIGTRDIIEDTLERIQEEYAAKVTILEKAAASASRNGARFVIDGVEAPYVVLATGVMDRQPSIKKTKREQVQDDPKWVYPFANHESVLYCIRCEGHLTEGTRAAVIGSGESAGWLAIMLHERYGSACCILTNGETPAFDAETQGLLDAYGIGVKTARIIDLVGGKGELNRILLEDGSEAGVAFALVAMGLHRVYNDLAVQLGAKLTDPDQPIEVRHVEVDKRGETSVRGLFAAGDMIRHADGLIMKQVYTSQEYAVRAVDAIDARVRAARRPTPGAR